MTKKAPKKKKKPRALKVKSSKTPAPGGLPAKHHQFRCKVAHPPHAERALRVGVKKAKPSKA